MYREETNGERFLIPVSGTRLGAAHGNAPYDCVKVLERMTVLH